MGCPYSRYRRHLAVALAITTLMVTAVNAEDKAATRVADWKGRIAFGGALTSGNSDVYTVNFDAKAEREWSGNRVRLATDALWGRSNGETDNNRQSIFGGYRRYLTDTFFLYFDTTAERNPIQSIRLRVLTNVGPGWRVWEKGEKRYLDLEAGVGYLHENFSNDEDTRNDGTLRAAADYKEQFGRSLEFSQTIEIIAPIGPFGSYIANAESILSIPIIWSWNLRNALRLDYQNNPAPGRKKLDTILTVGLEYVF